MLLFEPISMESRMNKTFIHQTKISQMLKTLVGSFAKGCVCAAKCCDSLIHKLIDASFVGFFALDEKAAKDMIATDLRQVFRRCQPFEGFGRCEGQILIEVKSGLFSYFNRRCLFHPDIDYFRKNDIGRHDHRGQDLALAYIFFP